MGARREYERIGQQRGRCRVSEASAIDAICQRKIGQPSRASAGGKKHPTLFKEAFDETVTTRVNGRPRSITKQEMALRQLANGAARGDAKALELLMKYAPVMSEIAPELAADSDPTP